MLAGLQVRETRDGLPPRDGDRVDAREPLRGGAADRHLTDGEEEAREADRPAVGDVRGRDLLFEVRLAPELEGRGAALLAAREQAEGGEGRGEERGRERAAGDHDPRVARTCQSADTKVTRCAYIVSPSENAYARAERSPARSHAARRDGPSAADDAPAGGASAKSTSASTTEGSRVNATCVARDLRRADDAPDDLRLARAVRDVGGSEHDREGLVHRSASPSPRAPPRRRRRATRRSETWPSARPGDAAAHGQVDRRTEEVDDGAGGRLARPAPGT